MFLLYIGRVDQLSSIINHYWITTYTIMPALNSILQDLQLRFGEDTFHVQNNEILTLWMPKEKLRAVINYLKSSIEQPYKFLYDLCGVDERDRAKKGNIPALDFTIVYHLFSFD